MRSVVRHFEQGVRTVYTTLTSREYLEARSAALNEEGLNLTIVEEGEQLVVRMVRDVRRDVPRFARRILKPTNEVEQVDRWSAQGDGFVSNSQITVRGTPVSLVLTQTLKPSQGGTEFMQVFEIKVRVPLIGRKIESMVWEQTEAGTACALNVLTEHLARSA